MPITTAQRERRPNHLGASDIAALFGCDPFQTAYDIYLAKTRRVHEKQTTELMDLGNKMEPFVLDFAAEQLGPIRRNQYRSHPTLPMASHLDAILIAEQENVEAKTSGVKSVPLRHWGEDGSDQVPEHVIIQVHAQMLCMCPKLPAVAHVPVFIGLRGLLMFHVERDERIIEAISERAYQFWTGNVVADVPPDGYPTLSVAKLLRRTPGKMVALDPSYLLQWTKAKDAYKNAKDVRDQSQAELLAAMGDAEVADFGTFGTVTNREQHRKESVSKASTYRVMRHKEAKNEGAVK